MIRKPVSLILLVFLAIGAAIAAEGLLPASKKAGYALLDLYINTFKEMASSGSNGVLDANLNKMIAEAKKARTAGDIDAVFLARYSRLIGMTKLIMIDDHSKTIAPFINAEVGRFVRETLGEEPIPEGPGAIGQMANAMAFAIVDLQIYLDTFDSRQERYEKFIGKFGPEK